jgi:hypothetical protein
VPLVARLCIKKKTQTTKFTRICNKIEKKNIKKGWPSFFSRTRMRSARLCIKHKEKCPEAGYTAQARGGTSTNHRRPPLWATAHHPPNTDYSIFGIVPRLHCIQARQSSSNMRRVTCAVLALRWKTLAFLSSHNVRMTRLMKEFAAFLSV